MKSDIFVFDTNVLLSALFNDTSIPGKALKKAREKGIIAVSDEVAAEYVAVFARKKFDKYVVSARKLLKKVPFARWDCVL